MKTWCIIWNQTSVFLRCQRPMVQQEMPTWMCTQQHSVRSPGNTEAEAGWEGSRHTLSSLTCLERIRHVERAQEPQWCIGLEWGSNCLLSSVSVLVSKVTSHSKFINELSHQRGTLLDMDSHSAGNVCPRVHRRGAGVTEAFQTPTRSLRIPKPRGQCAWLRYTHEV